MICLGLAVVGKNVLITTKYYLKRYVKRKPRYQGAKAGKSYQIIGEI